MEDFIADLYAEHYKYLIYLIKNRLYEGCPKDLAYDCLNEVFQIALEKKDSKGLKSNPKGWLILTARNVVDNYNRKFCRRNSYIDWSADILAVPQQRDLFEEQRCDDFLEHDFQEFFEKNLSKEEKDLYYLKYTEELSLTEIGQRLHITPNAANTKLNRLRKKIKHFIRKNID